MPPFAVRNVWKPLVLTAALAFVYTTVLVKLGYDWYEDPNYSHGLLMPFVVGLILWMKRDELGRTPQQPSLFWGGSAMLCALLALWLGTAGAELYIQRMSLVLMLAGLVVYFFGFKVLRQVLVPLALLVLAIPIPAIIFNKIAFPLQLFASRCAVWAMRLFDIPVLREGNIIELMPLGSTQTKKLEVVEACSGIRSLMTLVTLAAIFAYFTRPGSDGHEDDRTKGGRFGWLASYGFWRAGILLLSSIPIAIITNAFRVSGTGVLSRYYGTEVADGFFHSFSGWVVYIVAALLLFAVGWILDRLRGQGRRGQDRTQPDEARAVEPAANTAGAPVVTTISTSTKGAE